MVVVKDVLSGSVFSRMVKATKKVRDIEVNLRDMNRSAEYSIFVYSEQSQKGFKEHSKNSLPVQVHVGKCVY